MQILQPSFKLLQTFLNDNPELTQKYVNTSVTAISHLLGPLNVFMRHLLVVKGLDPDSNPDERAVRELRQAMSQAFESHQKAYDDDYDFSWVQKRFDETRNHLKELQLTKERYLDLTNLAKLPDDVKDEGGDFTLSRTAKTVVVKNNDPETKPYEVGTSAEVTAAVVNATAPVSSKREIRLTAEDKGLIQDLQNFITKTKAAEVSGDQLGFDPGDALKELSDLITRTDKIVDLSRTAEKRSSKKKNKTTKKTAPKKIVKVGDHYALTGGPRATGVIARIVDDMVAKGLCDDAPEAKAAQAQEMDKWNEDSFEAIKRLLDKHVKTYPGNKETDTKFRGTFRRASSKKV